jgi:hypothetical protein
MIVGNKPNCCKGWRDAVLAPGSTDIQSASPQRDNQAFI